MVISKHLRTGMRPQSFPHIIEYTPSMTGHPRCGNPRHFTRVWFAADFLIINPFTTGDRSMSDLQLQLSKLSGIGQKHASGVTHFSCDVSAP